MAYCDKCGAYIPDGQSKCLACGYNGTEEASPAAAAAAQQTAEPKVENDVTYHFRNDDERYRVQLEENRRRQQEQNKKWAEQEYQRRQAQKQYRDDLDEKRKAAGNNAKSAMSDVKDKMEAGGWSSERLWSVLSYVSVLCIIPLLTGKGGARANFHAKQGVRLVVFGAIADILGRLPLIGWVFNAARFVLMIIGIINALNDRQEPLPYIGNIGSF